MIRDDYLTITEDEMDKVIDPFEEKIRDHVINEILTDFVAYYIANGYKMNCLWRVNIDVVLESAIDSLVQLKVSDCNLEKIKRKLIENYNLEIVNNDPIDIK